MPKHVHAELMMQYAQDAMENERPWELWEVKWENDKDWDSLYTSPQWNPENEYRRKPKTVNINGFEVVQELFEEANPDEIGYIERADEYGFWIHGLLTEHRVKYGVAHKTKESAIASCKARLGIDPNS